MDDVPLVNICFRRKQHRMVVWREYGSRFVLMRTITDRLVYIKINYIPKGWGEPTFCMLIYTSPMERIFVHN